MTQTKANIINVFIITKQNKKKAETMVQMEVNKHILNIILKQY